MGEVAVSKVTGKLPGTLLEMLDVLVTSNGLHSFQIYSDSYGVSVRIRFGHDGSGNVCVDSAGHTGSQAHNSKTNGHMAFTKKTPSQVKRDQKRRIVKAKKRKLSPDDTCPEIVRAEDSSFYEITDTPEKVCDRSEDTLVVPPTSPLIFAKTMECSLTKTPTLVCKPADIQLRISPVPPFDY